MTLSIEKEYDGSITEEGKSKSSATPRASMPEMEQADWNRRYESTEFIWSVEVNQFLAAEAAGLSAGRALDLASGEGRNSVWLAEQGWSVSSIDFSDVAIAKAHRLATARNVIDKIDFKVADLRTYAPETGSFDLVTLVYLQIPQVELLPIVARAARAVAPGGTFLLIAHDSTNLEHGYGGPQRADILYTADQVAVALDGSFEVEKACRVTRSVKTDDGTKIAFDCLVRAKRR